MDLNTFINTWQEKVVNFAIVKIKIRYSKGFQQMSFLGLSLFQGKAFSFLFILVACIPSKMNN
jgi:hypothetical protein